MALAWEAPLDPNEHKDYVRDWAAEMTALGDTITEATFVLPPAAEAATFVVDRVFISDGKKVAMWIKAADPVQAAALNGQALLINHTITTAAGRIYNETIKLKVKEK